MSRPIPPIPPETVETFARTIYREASKYGFAKIDFIRLINVLLDLPTAAGSRPPATELETAGRYCTSTSVDTFPLRSDRLSIRLADTQPDTELLNRWLNDEYGRHFLLTASTARSTDLRRLLDGPDNEVGIISEGDEPIGAVAYLGIDKTQRRAELRKLIGKSSARGKGYAEEATHLWIQYGGHRLGLEKIYVSTLQTHLRNIQLNESIGFKVEGVLRREVLIDGERYDILRMGLCFDEYISAMRKVDAA